MQLYADETGQPAPEGMGDAWIREELLAQNAQGLDRAAKVVASAVTPPNSTLVGDALAHAALQYLRLRLPGTSGRGKGGAIALQLACTSLKSLPHPLPVTPAPEHWMHQEALPARRPWTPLAAQRAKACVAHPEPAPGSKRPTVPAPVAGDRTLEALDDMLVVHFNRRIEPNLPLLLRKTNLVELQVLALLAALAVTKKIALAGGAGVEARLAGLQQELYRALAHYRGSICGAARLAVVLCLALKVLGTAVKVGVGSGRASA